MMAWITVALFGATTVGFLAGMFAAEYKPPAPPLRYVEPPASHVFVVEAEYNGMPTESYGYSDPPEFYDWAVDGECVHREAIA